MNGNRDKNILLHMYGRLLQQTAATIAIVTVTLFYLKILISSPHTRRSQIPD